MKKWYESKTVWLNLILALSPILPFLHDFAENHVEMFSAIWGLLAIALRLITKDKIILKDQ